MSSWKLTKKLKETNFLRGHTQSSRRQSTASTKSAASESESTGSLSSSGSPQKNASLETANAASNLSNNKPAGHSGIRNASSRETLVEPTLPNQPTPNTPPSIPASSSNSQYSRTNTLTEKSQLRGTVTSRDGTISASQSVTPETNAHDYNPRLLRVTIYELKGLAETVEAYRSVLPAWAFDKTSTKPPPVYLVLDYDKTQILLYAIGGTVSEPVWDKTTSFDVATTTSATLSVSCYLRTKQSSAAGSAADQSEHDTPGDKALNNGLKDVLLGTGIVSPTYFSQAEQLSIGGAGVLGMKCEVNNTKNQPLSIDDFTLLKVVGKGSFGKVMQVRKNDTRQIYALKTIRKAHIVSKAEVGHTLAERTVLAKINNPFIVPLKFSFQSPEKLYLVLAFVNGGELFHHLQREGHFDLNRARFYTAELLCALECLHEYNVIYRDLKPENILLDYTGHIALCDFGLCKLNMGSKDQTTTFCGTPEYLAPELLLGQGYTKAVDWWTLGVLFYEMLAGLPPFYDTNVNTMYHKIVKDPLVFPPEMDREAKSLITGLLDRDPKKRLGANGASEIKAHPFFHQIDWQFLLNKKYAAPFLPSVTSAVDTSNFDSEFTSEPPTDSFVDKASCLSDSVQQQFGGWSYSTESKLTAEKWI